MIHPSISAPPPRPDRESLIPRWDKFQVLQVPLRSAGLALRGMGCAPVRAATQDAGRRPGVGCACSRLM